MTARLAALALGMLVCVGRPVQAEAMEGRRLAVVVGIDEYQDSEWPPLRFADKDARDIAAALSGSFHKVLQLEKAPPKRAAVLELLDELDRLNTADLDTVLVHISAHGTLARNARGRLVRVLVMQDTDSDHPMNTGSDQVSAVSSQPCRRRNAYALKADR